MPLADQARLLELRELTPVRGASVERLPTAPTAELASDTHWGWHLSGFVAAEGHVSLRDAASKFAPQFTVVQRVDNIPLLEAYRDRLAIGTIRVRPAGRGINQMAEWSVTRIGDCAVLVDYLTRFPLPACSPKAAQVEVWAGALAVRAKVTDGGRRHGARASSELAEAYQRLRAMKEYKGPRLLCDCRQPATSDVE